MKVKEFSKQWKEFLDNQFEAFEENFELNNVDWIDWIAWIKIWVAWNELSCDEDIECAYDWEEEE